MNEKQDRPRDTPDGLHMFIPKNVPVDLATFEKKYQEDIKKGPLFKEMVKKFGKKKAKKLLKEFKVIEIDDSVTRNHLPQF